MEVNLIRELGLFSQVAVSCVITIILGWKLKLCETTTSIALVFYHKTKLLFPTEKTDHHVSMYLIILYATHEYCQTTAPCHG